MLREKHSKVGHRHGAGRRPEGVGVNIAEVAQGVKADPHPGFAIAEETIAASVREAEGDTEATHLADRRPRRHPVAVTVMCEIAAATNSQAEEVMEGVQTVVAVAVEAIDDLLQETPVGRENYDHHSQ